MRNSLGLQCILLVALLPAMTGCPNPLTREIMHQVKDKTGPVVTITSPLEGTFCSRMVIVTGRAEDSSGSGEPGSVKSLRYEVMASVVSGDVPLGRDGSYSFLFSTVSLGSSFVLHLVAMDWNGNTGEASITLFIEPGNDIPSFAASPSNHEVMLRWDPVPGALSYTLHYTANGAIPSADYGTHVPNVISGLRMQGLSDGAPYVFRLQAISTEGGDNWSAAIKAIPLSPLTLCPTVRGGVGKISLEWVDIPGTDEYDVLRSSTRQGLYIKIIGGVRGTTYEDREVVPYEVYFYRVCPLDAADTPSAPSWGSACAFSEDAVRMTGSYAKMWRLNGACVAVSGRYAFLSLGNASFVGYESVLDIVDVSNSLQPVYLSSQWLGQGINDGGRDIVIDSDMAYVSGPDPSILSLIDVSDPATPGPLNRCMGFTDIQGLCVIDGSHIAAADGSGGLRIVDVSIPAAPFIESTFATSGIAYGVAFDAERNQYIVADGSAGVTLIDRNTGTAHTCATRGIAYSVAIGGGFALVADGAQGLAVVAVDNPSNPTLAATLDLTPDLTPPSIAIDVSVSGSLAALACGSGGLCIVDVSNPTLPFLAGSDETPLDATSVTFALGHIFLADHDDTTAELKLYDIASDRPSLGAGVTLAATDGGDLDSNGTHLFYTVGFNGAGLEIMDLASRSVVGHHNGPGGRIPMAVLARGNFAFITYADFDSDTQIEILDMEDPGNPRLLSQLSVPGVAALRFVAGDCAYIVGQAGFQILDVSDPSSPELLSKMSIPGTSFNLEISAGHAYATVFSCGLAILDVSQPTSPQILGSCAVAGVYQTVCTSGGYCFVGGSESWETGTGIHVVDVKDLNNLVQECVYRAPFRANATKMADPFLFVAGSGCVAILDVGKPLHPCTSAMGAIDSSGSAGGFVIHGQYLYANTGSGVTVVDITGGQ